MGARDTGSTCGKGGITPAKVPAYLLLDAMVSCDFQQRSLALDVCNLTDKTYLSNCDGAAQSCFYGDQRGLIATATYRW
ncbi:TonB-dependent receptor [Paracidovorax avenae]|uniref:TonB-dependent receptor n=1 Tax=Paracidovorax avenae TaxID=80867 RepID=UPI0001BF24B4|nr:TonB-dependent receptor [Paracidovorax avenae]